MPQRTRLTVAPAKGGEGWTLAVGGGNQTTFRTKDAAVREGSAIGRSDGHAQLIIKGRNGRIQSERTYGADPRRTKG